MREEHTQGIVVHKKEVGESDLVVNFFTLDYGRMVFRAKGAKRSKKRFVGLETFSHHKLAFRQGRQGRWPTLLRLESIEMYAELRHDLGAYAAANYVAELFLKLTQEGDANPRLFQLLSSFLTYNIQKSLTVKTLCRFHLRLLEDLGLQPDWHHCMECGRPFGEESFFSFDLGQGGVLCQACSPPGSRTTRPLRRQTQRLLSSLQERKSIDLPTPPPWENATELLNSRIDHLLRQPPQTREFLYEMNPNLPTPPQR